MASIFHALIPQYKFSPRLGIANEKLFVDISLVLETAISWEDKAKFILEHAAHLSEFDELIRFIAHSPFPTFCHFLSVRNL